MKVKTLVGKLKDVQQDLEVLVNKAEPGEKVRLREPAVGLMTIMMTSEGNPSGNGALRKAGKTFFVVE